MANPQNTSIGNFGSLAQRYWEAGYTVVPVKPSTRESAVSYNGLVNQVPAPATKLRLLKNSEMGIGLLLGQTAGDGFRTIAIDVDDDRIVRFVAEIVGDATAPAKFGSKGRTFFVRMSEGIKGTVISNKGMGDTPKQLVDILSTGNMTVLPPSIHWKTGEPYRWVSDNTLPEVAIADWPVFEGWKLALLRRVLEWKRLGEILGGIATHDPMRDLIFYSMGWFGPDPDEPDTDLIRRALAVLLPEGYEGNTIKELDADRGRSLINGALADDQNGKKKYPRPGEGGKQSASSKLIDQIEEAAAEFFHDGSGATFIATKHEDGGTEVVATDSQAARTWLMRLARKAGLLVLSEKVQKELCGMLHARALFEGEQREVFVRVGQSASGNIVIDLAQRGDGRAIVIDPKEPGGFCVTADHGIYFWRPDGMSPLPEPKAGGSLLALRDLLGIRDNENWARVVGFLLSSFRPRAPYMGLAVTGAEGSGKSVLCELLKSVIDPTRVARSIMPTKIDDMVILVGRKMVTVLDNVSGMRRDMSDALCMVLTGGGLEVRTLYTNRELSVIELGRPIILNGISEFVSQSDLMSRLILLEAEEPETRRTEETIKSEFEVLHPQALGALCQIVSLGMCDLADTPTDPDSRNADVIRWLTACEPHAGFEPGAIAKAIASAQAEANTERVENDPTYGEICRVIEKTPFIGTTAQLYDLMVTNSDKFEGAGGVIRIKGFPANAIALGKWLARNKRVLKVLGVNFERRHVERGSFVVVWREGQDPDTAQQVPHHKAENAERISGSKY